MISFDKTENNKIEIKVDKNIYNDTVISKVLYWLTDSYFIYQNCENGMIQKIILEKKENSISNDEFVSLKNKLNQDFIDFKVRDIITNETKNIRDILYIKAFNNSDEFADYNLV
jgi:His-Xaa-Ser system protein HxsD